MIRIELDEATVARTRIATSPLWETICGLYLLRHTPAEVPWPYASWARDAREVLADLPADAPVRLYNSDLGRMSPDFFCPIPQSPAPTIDEELAALRRTAPAEAAAQLARYYPGEPPAALVPFRDDPSAAFDRLASGLLDYWDAAVAPYWSGMRAALEEEVLLRARALAAHGPDALLADLHERVRWQPPVLTLVKSLDHSFTSVDQRLVLIPLIFSRGALMCSSDDPEVLAVSYQSRGAAVLAGRETGNQGAPQPWSGPAAERACDDRLGMLLGRGRASVLRGLRSPATTAGLATALGLAPSTVSQHLAGLAEAGIVHRRRVGRRVLYGLEPAGLALVQLLGPAD